MINRSLSSIKRTTLALALFLSPMIFMGAECANEPFPNVPLAMNAMRAEVTTEGSFVCDQVVQSASSSADYWLVVAQGDATVGNRRIELRIPKQTTAPFTINVASDDEGSIYYCLPLTQTSCKNFYANQAQGGSGTIRVTNVTGSLEGTFSGTVQLSNGSETRTITSGEFKVDL